MNEPESRTPVAVLKQRLARETLCQAGLYALDEIDISIRRKWSKKSVQQGRSHFDARSVLTGREHGRMARTPLAAFFTIP
ncbi:MAG: hypothetical protein VST68_00735 [Nitrospirota bacterium]|nr:hypothetical protein [Nitrospirota bacterium]